MEASHSVGRYRSIWISDVHLGTKECKADALLDFLRHTESDVLYLVGDVVDGWALRRSWHWPQGHNDVVQKLLRKARKGTRVVYVPGNHDEFARAYVGHRFGGVEVVADAIHVTADGRRLWVVHGDAFDLLIRDHKVLVWMGDVAYAWVLRVHRVQAWLRRRLGLREWSLAAYVKSKAKKAMEAMCHFEAAIVGEARRRGADAVVCGHVHQAEIVERDGLLYCNDGDWVDSCTALVEHIDGRLEILRWRSDPRAVAAAWSAEEDEGAEAACAAACAAAAEPTGHSSPALTPVLRRARLSARVSRRPDRTARRAAP